MIVAGRALLVDDARTLQGLRHLLAEHARRFGTVPASVRQIADELDALTTALSTDAAVSSAGPATTPQGTVTVMEAAAEIGITAHGVRDLIRRGRLAAENVDGRYYPHADGVAAYTPRRDR